MIAVTCRNGEQFSIDPGHIERVETSSDTTIHLVDGRKYVVSAPFDDLLRAIRDHRAALLVAQQRIYGGIAVVADQRAKLRLERRSRSREGDIRISHPDRDEE